MYLQISLYSSTLRVQVSFAINLSGPKLTPCVVILINMFGQIPAEKIKTHYGLHKLKTLSVFCMNFTVHIPSPNAQKSLHEEKLKYQVFPYQVDLKLLIKTSNECKHLQAVV